MKIAEYVSLKVLSVIRVLIVLDIWVHELLDTAA